MPRPHLLALALAAGAAHTALAQVVFLRDGLSSATVELATREWRGGGAATLIDRAAGGNPGEHLEIELTVNPNPLVGPEPPNGSIIVALLFPAGAAYDPAVSGEIDRIDFTEDLRFVSSSAATTSGHSRALALRQGDRLYIGTLRTTGTSATWAPATPLTLRAANFAEFIARPGVFVLDPTSNPDFGPAAPPIDLGLYRAIATGAPGSPGFTVTTAVDNWRVAVFPVAGPVCYPNCDASTTQPILNALDFACFLQRFVSAQSLPPAEQVAAYANCDASTTAPVLNALDFSCFLQRFAAACP